MGEETVAARLGLQGAQAAVLTYIERQGGRVHQTADGIGKAAGYSTAAANQALHRLRGRHLIWVDGYKQARSHGKPIPVYCLNEPVIAALLDEETGALGLDLAEAYAEEGHT